MLLVNEKQVVSFPCTRSDVLLKMHPSWCLEDEF